MLYTEYVERFRRLARGVDVMNYAVVQELGRPWPLLRLKTRGTHHCLITAGFHGEEPAGPLSVLTHLEELLDHALARDVALTLRDDTLRRLDPATDLDLGAVPGGTP